MPLDARAFRVPCDPLDFSCAGGKLFVFSQAATGLKGKRVMEHQRVFAKNAGRCPNFIASVTLASNMFDVAHVLANCRAVFVHPRKKEAAGRFSWLVLGRRDAKR